jgi:hypothetical protein
LSRRCHHSDDGVVQRCDRMTQPALPSCRGTIFAHLRPLASAIKADTNTVAPLCSAPTIGPFGRLRTFKGVPVGSLTVHDVCARASSLHVATRTAAPNHASTVVFIMFSSHPRRNARSAATNSAPSSPRGCVLLIPNWIAARSTTIVGTGIGTAPSGSGRLCLYSQAQLAR